MNSVLTDKIRKAFTFTTEVILAGSSWNILQTMNGKVFPEWLQSSSGRCTAMAGRQAGMEPSFPPLCSHTSAAVTAAVTVTGSHGINHSAFSAGGGGGGGARGNEDAERLFTEAAAAAASQQDHQAPFQRNNKGKHTRACWALASAVCGGWMRLFRSPAPI